MGNKRVSQLVELTTAEVQPNDLFLIIDTSARESKKIQAQDVVAFLNASGSIKALHAVLADTASYLSPGGINWVVPSSSFATNAISASFATLATTANNTISSSYAQTASWAINAINSGTTLITGSIVPITASWANNALLVKSASFLIYAGFPNGTSSYALKSGTSILADSASFLIGGTSVVTASYALVAGTTNNVNAANTASYLVFSPNNGTASYALVAQVAQDKMNNFGLFNALSQNVSNASIGDVNISSSLGTPQQTLIEAFGTVILNYTASISNSANINLITINTLTGVSSSLDAIQISHNTTPILDQWNTLMTASIRIPFVLAGQDALFGDYYVAVTSSAQNLVIDNSRTVRFTVSSFANLVSASAGQTVDFYYAPTNTPITFSSFAGGPFHDSLTGILATGSANIKIIDMSNLGITDVRFTWKCQNLTDFSCSSNTSLTTLNYSFPNTMSNLYCDSCSVLSNIADLSNTKIVNFSCGYNALAILPVLPDTVKYLNCSHNPLTNLPATFPSNLQVLIADFTSLSSMNPFDSSLLTASFNNCLLVSLPISTPFGIKKLICSNNSGLSSIPDLSATSMSYLDASSCGLLTLPSMSVSMSYLDISSNLSLPNTEVTTATGELTNSAQISGTFNALGYPPAYATPFYTNLLILSGTYGWTINASGFP